MQKAQKFNLFIISLSFCFRASRVHIMNICFMSIQPFFSSIKGSAKSTFVFCLVLFYLSFVVWEIGFPFFITVFLLQLCDKTEWVSKQTFLLTRFEITEQTYKMSDLIDVKFSRKKQEEKIVTIKKNKTSWKLKFARWQLLNFNFFKLKTNTSCQ